MFCTYPGTVGQRGGGGGGGQWRANVGGGGQWRASGGQFVCTSLVERSMLCIMSLGLYTHPQQLY